MNEWREIISIWMNLNNTYEKVSFQDDENKNKQCLSCLNHLNFFGIWNDILGDTCCSILQTHAMGCDSTMHILQIVICNISNKLANTGK